MANKLTKLDNLIRGDTPVLSFPITVAGAVVNLTGYKITFTATTANPPSSGNAPLIQIVVNGDNTGIANFQLLNGGGSLNDTSQLVPGTTYYWDVQVSNEAANPALRIFTVLRGTFGVDTDYNLSIL